MYSILQTNSRTLLNMRLSLSGRLTISWHAWYFKIKFTMQLYQTCFNHLSYSHFWWWEDSDLVCLSGIKNNTESSFSFYNYKRAK